MRIKGKMVEALRTFGETDVDVTGEVIDLTRNEEGCPSFVILLEDGTFCYKDVELCRLVQ